MVTFCLVLIFFFFPKIYNVETHIKCFKICYIFVNLILFVTNCLGIYLIIYIILKLLIKLFMTSLVRPPVQPRSDQ
jgi:hypothetical protein